MSGRRAVIEWKLVVDGALFFESDGTRQPSKQRQRATRSSRAVLSDISFLTPLLFLLSTSTKKKQEELATGEDVARCPSCSLHLHVVFDPGESRTVEFFFFKLFFRPRFLLTSSPSFQQTPPNDNSRLCRVPPGGLQAAFLRGRREQGRVGRMNNKKINASHAFPSPPQKKKRNVLPFFDFHHHHFAPLRQELPPPPRFLNLKIRRSIASSFLWKKAARAIEEERERERVKRAMRERKEREPRS